MANLQITSPAFEEGKEIPVQYSCKGENINPQLNITGVPQGAKSLVLVMHDPDAINGDFLHWLVWDIPAKDQAISPNNVPIGAIQGPNGSGNNAYIGPCPPAGTGTHRYMFELYAIDSVLNLDPKTSREQVEEAMKDHILSQNVLTGLFKAA